jgi:hypothetical protein
MPSPPNTTRQFVVVSFLVKPGVSPGTYELKNSAKITMKSNHPEAPEIKFYVEFIAT